MRKVLVALLLVSCSLGLVACGPSSPVSSNATNSPDPSIQAAAKAKAAAEAKAKAAAEAKAKAAAEAQARANRQAQQEASRAAAAAGAKAAARDAAAQKAYCLDVAQMFIQSYQSDIRAYQNDLADLEIAYDEALATGDFSARVRLNDKRDATEAEIRDLRSRITQAKAKCG